MPGVASLGHFPNSNPSQRYAFEAVDDIRKAVEQVGTGVDKIPPGSPDIEVSLGQKVRNDMDISFVMLSRQLLIKMIWIRGALGRDIQH